MDWNTLPGFNENYSKIRARQHNTFGGKVVEVLYGALDENNNPVYPKDADTDGHGRWFGIEIDGDYRMFSWKHPASEGGNIEYGTDHGENALEDMENDIRRKLSICREVEEVTRTNKGEGTEALEALKSEWEAMTDWGTPKEQEYTRRYERALAEYNIRYEEMEQNRADKQAIVDKANELSTSQSWKQTAEEFRTLQDEWDEIPSAGRENDDALWKQFSAARKAFNQSRKHFFENLDARNAENKEKKEALIAEAKGLLENVTNWKAAGEKINDLMESWKQSGSAGRDNDDALWTEFNGLRRQFFAARKAFFEERDSQRKDSVDKKSALIAEAKAIVEGGDFTKEKTDRMKELDKEWRSAGYSGKDDNDRLWNEFTAVKDEFWNGKRSENKKRFQEIIDRKNSTIASMKEQINELEIKKFETENFDRIRGYERRVDELKDIIDNLTKDIEDLTKKLNS